VGIINNAVLKFPKHHPAIIDLDFCKAALFLRAGQLMAQGNTKEVIEDIRLAS
jgi:hypothetical protein